MNYGLLFRTVKHLKLTQVYHQVKYRLMKPEYKALALGSKFQVSRFKFLKTFGMSEQVRAQVSGFRFQTEPIAKPQCWDGEKFTFLNLTHEFAGWDFNEFGNLWTYNQNYFDWLNQDGMTAEEGCKWIDRFNRDVLRTEISQKSGSKSIKSHLALDPYPIALRSINWVKFFCKYPECATKERVDALYSQVKLLEKKLEYHLLGNHLLEDAYAMYIACASFRINFVDSRHDSANRASTMALAAPRVQDSGFKKARKLLLEQLEEQVLPDGAHYEQSPMYHCILLDRLLDCINIVKGLLREKSDKNLQENTSKSRITELENYLTSDLLVLTSFAERMLGHLESVVWKDGTIPMLNDSAEGIAPTLEQLFDYAKRLGLEWKAIPMKECGYRKMVAGRYEAIVDVGNITATYQPGHTHADTLNYELRIDGKPVVVDCGISTYNKTERRQYERSTAAHNCVVVDGKDSSEVWGGFRVARRATVSGFRFQDSSIEAEHDGFGRPCKRRFEMSENGFTVEDWYDGEAVSYVHIAEGNDEFQVSGLRFQVEGAIDIEESPWKYSTEYNRFKEGKEIRIHFNGKVKYTVR